MKVDVTFYEEWAEWTAKEGAILARVNPLMCAVFIKDVASVATELARASRNPLKVIADPLKPARERMRVIRGQWEKKD
jgi:hypothetical protein